MINSKTLSESVHGYVRWGLFWSYSALVVTTSVVPIARIPRFFFRFHINDKWDHTLVYFLLFLISYYAFRLARSPRIYRDARRKAFYYCLAMGAFTEVLQLFSPYRSAEFLDWAADLIGAGFAYVLTLYRSQPKPLYLDE